MYQAGVKNITLYENSGIEFYYYDPLDLSKITQLTSLGTTISVLNEQRPEFDVAIERVKEGRIGYDYTIEFLLLALINTNHDLINTISNSIYGWCFLVEFYDGTYKFYYSPTFMTKAEIKPHDEMSFSVELKNPVPSFKSPLFYTPGISTLPVYRADTTLLTADNTIYTADYAL